MKIEEYLLGRLSVLEDKRKTYENIWDKAAELCYVDSRIYVEDKNRKERMIQNVFDSTARNALTYFMSSLKSILVPSTELWHRIKSSNPTLEEDSEVYAYLQKVTDILFKVRYAPRSKFSSEVDIMLSQIGIYGIGVMYLEDGMDGSIIYRCIPINEIYIDENRFGVIDTVYRKYKLTARQAYDMFGENLSKDIKDCLDLKPNQEFEFIHAVEPRKDRNPKAKDYTGMPIASYHIEKVSKKVVKESGYRTMPYMIPHYLRIAGSPYGDSPAMQAFADMLTANEMAKTIIRTAQLQANPPILTNSSVMDNNKLGRAGAIVRGGLDSQGRQTAVPMQYGNNLAVSLEMQQATRLAIEKVFLLPLFQSLTQEKEMTATEVEKRELEKSMLLAPMCERISSEWLAPMIERELDILSQYGFFDDVPDILMQEGSLAIEFESPYIRMQETTRIMGLYKTSEAAMTFSQFDPSVLNKFNPYAAIEEIAKYYDVDSKVLRSDEEFNALQEQQATLKQAEQALGASEVLTKSMKNLGIKVNPNAVPNV